MSATFQTIPITHLDLTSPRGKQVLQDALDQLVGMFAAGRIKVEHLSPELQETLQIQLSGASFVGCRLQFTAGQAQAIPTGARTAINFGSVANQTINVPGVWHDPAGTPSRVVIPQGYNGYYSAYGAIQWEANATGERLLNVTLYDPAVSTSVPIAIAAVRHNTDTVAGARTCQACALGPVYGRGGQYFQIEGLHTRGANNNVLDGTFLAVQRAGS